MSDPAPPETGRPETANPETGRVVTTDGTQVAWRAGGQGATHLVLLHGALMSGRAWAPVMARLAGDTVPGGLRCIALDVPGFGASSPPAGSHAYPEQAARLTEAIVALCGTARVVLAGHSLGGAIAMHVACAAPALLAGLAILDSGLARPHGTGSLSSVPGVGADDEARTAALRAYVARWLHRPSPEAVSRLMQDALAVDPATLAEVRAAIAGHDLRGRLDLGELPLLVLRGAEDRTRLHDEMQALLALSRQSVWVEIPEAGHCPQVERPDATAAALRQWLATGVLARTHG